MSSAILALNVDQYLNDHLLVKILVIIVGLIIYTAVAYGFFTLLMCIPLIGWLVRLMWLAMSLYFVERMFAAPHTEHFLVALAFGIPWILAGIAANISSWEYLHG